MQITKITLVEGLQGCDIILLIIILIIYTAIFFCLKESKKNQYDENGPFVTFISGIILISLSFFIIIYQYKETTKYSIEYNSGTLTKTMTTQEIIDCVLRQDTYYNKDKKTSNIIIEIPGNLYSVIKDNRSDPINSIFYEHVEEMNGRLEEKRKADSNKKYLQETHTLNIKK